MLNNYSIFMSDSIFSKEYSKLNEEQKKAVDALLGLVLVIAGPGSGKTQLLALRVANILHKTDADPSNILCLTFTDSASMNMRERLVKFIGNDAYKVHINTFHGFGTWMMNEFPEHFHNKFDFSVIDPIESKEIFNRIIFSLPASDALSSYNKEHGYAYQGSIESSIGKLRKAGISPKVFRELIDWNNKYYQIIQEIIKDFPLDRMSKKTADQVLEILEALSTLEVDELHGQISFAEYIAEKSRQAIEEYEATQKTTPLTKWKAEFLEKNVDHFTLKVSGEVEKLYSLANIYEQYLSELFKLGLYDFDNMIVDVIDLLENNHQIRSAVQEKFQFILVDEFQDTSPSQMRLIELLAYDPIDNNPNILAVGDDDQAIYSFQGADSSNINRFIKKFPKLQSIVLTKNYRSSQEILDFAMHNINNSDKRLTYTHEKYNKDLIASNKSINHGDIEITSHRSIDNERNYIIEKIKQLISKNVSPDDIAIIARKNYHLTEMAGLCLAENIPVFFEKDTNILDHPKIIEIFDLLHLISIWSGHQYNLIDFLLHKVMKQEHWDISMSTIHETTVRAYNNRISLRKLAENHEDEKIKHLVNVLDHYSRQVDTLPAEIIIHNLIGNNSEQKICTKIKQCYFHDSADSERISFYTALSSLFTAIREYKKGSIVSLDDVVEYIKIAKDNNIYIKDSHPIRTADSAISLLTAHKSKGLEFDHVFLIHADASTWGKGRNNNKISIPPNIVVKKPEDENEIIRLQYVALTRAKSHLYISRFLFDDKGKETSRLATLAGEEKYIESKEIKMSPPTNLILELEHTEENIIKGVIDNLILTPTSLDSFLDLEYGGPQNFVDKHIFRFPSVKERPSELGTLIHNCLYDLYNSKLDLDQLLERKTYHLQAIRMEEKDIEWISYMSEELLRDYYELKYKTFDHSKYKELWLEKKIKTHIGEYAIRGTLDACLIDSDKNIHVIDYKTGNPVKSFRTRNKQHQAKMHKYKRQLYLYALMIEESSPAYSINSGSIQFIKAENNEIYEPNLEFESTEKERTKLLFGKIDSLIRNLQFPDTSSYEPSLSGTLAFEDDILNGKYD